MKEAELVEKVFLIKTGAAQGEASGKRGFKVELDRPCSK
jgi:hypothetical protein